MRIRTYLTAIVGASALAMAVTAQAQDATETGSGSTMDKPSSGMMMKHSKSGVHSVSGQVQSVSEDSLTVRNKAGKDQTLTLGSDTKYTEHGKHISRSDVTEGARVRATFKGSGESLHATEIRVLRTGQTESKKSGMEGKGSGTSSSSSQSDETGGGSPAAGTSGTGSSNVSGGGAGAKPDSDTSTGASDAGTGSSGTGAGTEKEMKGSDAGTGSSGTGTSGTDGGY